MGRETPRGPHLAKGGYTGQDHDGLHGSWFTPQTVKPSVIHSSTMAPRRKNAAPHSSPTASQSEGDNASESSSSEANVPPNKLVDKPVEASRISVASKIQDVANPLFGRKSGAVGPLAVVPHTLVVIPQAEGQTESGESSQPASVAPSPPPTSTSQATGTFITLPTIFLEKVVADQRQTGTLVDRIVRRMPQLIERNVLAAEKREKMKCGRS
uniref:Integrase core domain containing protein n=1 Tax=Solanum tuberosum TaxID=4113 RepID=M1DQY0_SOLTU